MNLLSRVTIRQTVMARRVGEELVILDLDSGTYFGLDPVGAAIWRLMSEKRSLSEICDEMMNSYEVSRPEIEKDVVDLAQMLVAKGLIDVG